MIMKIPTPNSLQHEARYTNMRVLDLFSGAGGTALGFKRAGFTIIGAADNAPAAINTYHKNIGIQPHLIDLAAADTDELIHAFNLKPRDLEILVGCPPCQGFTRMVGKNGARDPRNQLVLKYLEFVKVLQPKCVVFENVPGLNKEHGEVFFKQLCEGLRILGYGFDYEHPGRILNAAHYGVAQFRKRLVLIAGRDGKLPPYPPATHGNPDSDDVKKGRLKSWVTVEKAIGKYPPISSGEANETYPNHQARKLGKRVFDFISLISEPGGSRTDVPEEYWLDCHKGSHTGHRDVYGRLPLDRPAGVMTSGCTNVSKGRFVHPQQNRGISFREAASLQSFPDDFAFEGNMEEIALQIGNAVPPLLAEAMGCTLAPWLLQNFGEVIPENGEV
jgi:DNA (cytosine-5)-methyltransferase 1